MRCTQFEYDGYLTFNQGYDIRAKVSRVSKIIIFYIIQNPCSRSNLRETRLLRYNPYPINQLLVLLYKRHERKQLLEGSGLNSVRYATPNSDLLPYCQG